MPGIKNIFLIEDDEDDQFFFKEAVSNIKNALLYDIADNGKHALEILNSSLILPDIIFLDLNMPVMNGYIFLSQLNQIPLLKEIPVIILSTSVRDCKSLQKLGAKLCIEKSFSVEELRLKIAGIINTEF